MLTSTTLSKSSISARFRDWLDRAPGNFSGSVLANMLGWQLLRVLFFNVTRRWRTVHVDEQVRPYATRLAHDGAIVIDNFLPPAVFVELQQEFERSKSGVEFKPLTAPYIANSKRATQVLVADFYPKPGSRLAQLIHTHVNESTLLKRLASTVVHTEVTAFREPRIFMNKRGDPQAPDLNTDIYYHADVSYPGFKAFLYLSDTDIQNGAFTYAKGTHKLTWKRWRWEYRKSIEHARARARVRDPRIQGDSTGRFWHCLTRDEEVREGIMGTPMVGRANSLVVFNVMGFHRRGDITCDRPREFVLVYYRS